MIIGVPKELFPGERRVALVPSIVPSLTKASLDVLVEPAAGESAGFPDQAYVEKGARIASSREQLFPTSTFFSKYAAPVRPEILGGPT